MRRGRTAVGATIRMSRATRTPPPTRCRVCSPPARTRARRVGPGLGANPVSFLLATQEPDGRFAYRSAPADLVATLQVLPALAGRPAPAAGRGVAVGKAVAWMLTQRTPEGGFEGFNPGATVDAVLALASQRRPANVPAPSGRTPLDYLSAQAPDYSARGAAAAGKLLAGAVALAATRGPLAGWTWWRRSTRPATSPAPTAAAAPGTRPGRSSAWRRRAQPVPEARRTWADRRGEPGGWLGLRRPGACAGRGLDRPGAAGAGREWPAGGGPVGAGRPLLRPVVPAQPARPGRRLPRLRRHGQREQHRPGARRTGGVGAVGGGSRVDDGQGRRVGPLDTGRRVAAAAEPAGRVLRRPGRTTRGPRTARCWGLRCGDCRWVPARIDGRTVFLPLAMAPRR